MVRMMPDEETSHAGKSIVTSELEDRGDEGYQHAFMFLFLRFSGFAFVRLPLRYLTF